MRNPVFQKVLDDAAKSPWYVKLKRYVRIEIHCVKCLGIKRYLRLKLKKLDI